MTKVLVVDDSAVDRRLAGGLLEKETGLSVVYAADGSEALTLMDTEHPDVVVTDLQMPRMNGLELVGAIRHQYPLVPVILMTAHGSEDIAVAALEQGAASYVPKSKLGEKLADTLEHVMGLTRSDHNQERLLECMTRVEFDFQLDNDSALVPPLVDFIQHNASNIGLCDETGRIRIGIALEEALFNALYHGNLELTSDMLREDSSQLLQTGGQSIVEQRRNMAPYNERSIHVHAEFTNKMARFVIRDEGPGFDPGQIPDPTDPENLERESGRGLLLMRSFMDSVSYSPSGNEVTLVKFPDSASTVTEDPSE
jgi:CheY-like chemotaxis protein/anti-sigma regulatory factor (Ser/Thr protein kinase)